MYPGLTFIGSNRFSGLYGLHDTIIDQKATGLQHLYIDSFEKDLIHTACSIVKCDDKLYYADRIKPIIGHASKWSAQKSYVENNAIMCDFFKYDSFEKLDRVAANESYIRFQTKIKNTSNLKKSFHIGALVITQMHHNTLWRYENQKMHLTISEKKIYIKSNLSNQAVIAYDAPSGFMYHGYQDFLYDNFVDYPSEGQSDVPLSTILVHQVDINPGSTFTFDFMIKIDDQREDESDNSWSLDEDFSDIKAYWESYLKDMTPVLNYSEDVKTKLVALKGALLNGFLPADLTGHYFANGFPAFYSRDALMGSRAFLYAGLYKDFVSIVEFFLSCQLKENGEHYQRYRFDGTGDEGANNNVFKQIDFIGYFCSIVYDYEALTGKLLVTFDKINELLSILLRTETKFGLYGPEGGVNEGVYGPAYIVSTNMFICGGLNNILKLAKKRHQYVFYHKWFSVYEKLFNAIEAIPKEESYYYYGYVTYHNKAIKRYDTPQLFGATLGYPLTDQYIASYQVLKLNANYFDGGIGYSEQEYHDGPWMFNTAAAAECAYMIEDDFQYQKCMTWIQQHQNNYGLLPEAIDAKDEKFPWINPLVWANSEFVCAAYAHIIKQLRQRLL